MTFLQNEILHTLWLLFQLRVKDFFCVQSNDENMTYEMCPSNSISAMSNVKNYIFQEFPWPPKPLNELNDITAPYLNEGACVLFFTGKSSKIFQTFFHK